METTDKDSSENRLPLPKKTKAKVNEKSSTILNSPIVDRSNEGAFVILPVNRTQSLKGQQAATNVQTTNTKDSTLPRKKDKFYFPKSFRNMKKYVLIGITLILLILIATNPSEEQFRKYILFKTEIPKELSDSYVFTNRTSYYLLFSVYEYKLGTYTERYYGVFNSFHLMYSTRNSKK